MDIATVIGFVGTMGLIAWAMDSAAGIGAFIDTSSVVIVFAGSIAVLLMRSTLPEFINAWAKVLMKAFLNKNENHPELIEQIITMANTARRDGVIALEGQLAELQNPFLAKGISMVVDGTAAEVIESSLTNDKDLMIKRHELSAGVFKSWKDIAPAMGMIGTLVGLVGMLQNMSDPKAIGPAMAVALLTTLYGAMIANCIFMPIVTKLEHYSSHEVLYRQMVVMGLKYISRGESPRNITDQLIAHLPPKLQAKIEEAA